MASKPPKTKLRFESETSPVPTLIVIRTEFTADPSKTGTYIEVHM